MGRSSNVMRYADRYLGIPVVYCLGLARRPRLAPDHVRRVGVIQPTAIGDLVLSSGLIGRLGELYPSASLYLLHGESNGGAVRLLSPATVPHECNFQNPVNAARRIRSLDLDILIDLTPWPRVTSIICWFSGAPFTVGFRASKQWRHFAYDLTAPHLSSRHEIENIKAIGVAIGLDEGACLPMLRVVGKPPDLGIRLSRLVIFHTQAGGSQAYAKSWPEANWTLLARALIDKGWTVGLTGSLADTAPVDRVVAAVGRPGSCFSLCGRLDLTALCAVLAVVPLTVTIDTAVLHLASAVNGSVIGLHGPTKSSRWGALNERSVSIDSPHPSSGYIHFGFEDHPDAALIMPALTVDMVLEAAEPILNQCLQTA